MKRGLSVLVVAGVLATACGSDDEAATDNTEQDDDGDGGNDEPDATDGSDDSNDTDSGDGDGDGDGDEDGDDTAAAVTPPPDEEEPDDGDDSDDDDKTVIRSLDDIPSACIDLMGAFLREIEEPVSGVDWENATMNDLEALGTAIEGPGVRFDEESVAAGCDDFELGPDDDQSIEFALEVARREAPGTVGYLTFLTSFLDVGPPAGGDDDTSAAGLPTDCEGTLDYLRAQAAEFGAFSAVPVSEFADLTTALSNMQGQCTPEQVLAFSEEPFFLEFLDG